MDELEQLKLPFEDYQDIIVIVNGEEKPAPLGPDLEEAFMGVSLLKSRVRSAVQMPSVQKAKKKLRPLQLSEFGYEPGLSKVVA